MKSEIFLRAIRNRNEIRFYYGTDEVFVQPYYITTDRYGNKVLYGKLRGTNEIKKFEYKFISNIRILISQRFSPIIPIIPLAS
jgi:hypothetical protein